MPVAFYVSDFCMLVLALGALASAHAQCRHQIVRRWKLLLPGVLATLASMANLAFPEIWDVVDPEIIMAGVIGFLIGGARGQFMRMDSDQNFGLVRLRDGRDELLVAYVFTAFAVVHFVIEMDLKSVNPVMPSGVLAMTLTGSYLLGRSVVGWVRAGRKHHTDLRD
jgi:hypothetical protein